MSEGFLRAAEALLVQIRRKLVTDIDEYKYDPQYVPADLSDEDISMVCSNVVRDYVLPGVRARRALSQIDYILESLEADETEAHALPLTTKSTLLSRLMAIEDDQTNPEREYADINKLAAWADDHGISAYRPVSVYKEFKDVGDFEQEAQQAADQVPEAAKDHKEVLQDMEAWLGGEDEHAEGATTTD